MTGYTDADLVIVIPLWRRPHRIIPVYESARAATPNANILFVCSPDDDASYEVLDSMRGRLHLSYEIATWPGGTHADWAKKINLAYNYTIEPLIFTGADDLDFHPGWFEAASGWFAVRPGAGYDDDGRPQYGRVGVVGTDDLCNERTASGEHSTHSLVARWYADDGARIDGEPGIFTEAYWHEYADDELVGIAKAHGNYAHAHDAVVEHLHPNVNKAEDDDVYRSGRSRRRQSRRMFLARQRLWAGPRRSR